MNKIINREKKQNFFGKGAPNTLTINTKPFIKKSRFF
jgi:hypothetical protein